LLRIHTSASIDLVYIVTALPNSAFVVEWKQKTISWVCVLKVYAMVMVSGVEFKSVILDVFLSTRMMEMSRKKCSQNDTIHRISLLFMKLLFFCCAQLIFGLRQTQRVGHSTLL